MSTSFLVLRISFFFLFIRIEIKAIFPCRNKNQLLRRRISKSKQNGYYITYNESFEKISGFTYSDTKSTLNYVRNVVSTSDNVYVTYQYTDLVIISSDFLFDRKTF